jgi:hypothetical protein
MFPAGSNFATNALSVPDRCACTALDETGKSAESVHPTATAFPAGSMATAVADSLFVPAKIVVYLGRSGKCWPSLVLTIREPRSPGSPENWADFPILT